MRIGLKFLKINNGVKKVQNFDEVTDTWLLTFLFSTNCDLGLIVNLMKKKKQKQNKTLRSWITYVDHAVTYVDWVDQNS